MFSQTLAPPRHVNLSVWVPLGAIHYIISLPSSGHASPGSGSVTPSIRNSRPSPRAVATMFSPTPWSTFLRNALPPDRSQVLTFSEGFCLDSNSLKHAQEGFDSNLDSHDGIRFVFDFGESKTKADLSPSEPSSPPPRVFTEIEKSKTKSALSFCVRVRFRFVSISMN